MSRRLHLPPLSDAAWPAEIADMKQGFAGQLNVYRVMAHHPALLAAWADLREHVVRHSALGPVRAEVVILRAAHRLGSEYEWAHHVERGRAVGLDPARIERLAGPLAAIEGEDALLARAVDALLDQHRLPGDIAADLAANLGKEAVLDLIATVGFYSTLGYILNTFSPPIDAGPAP